jgi:hypothetical protein
MLLAQTDNGKYWNHREGIIDSNVNLFAPTRGTVLHFVEELLH